MKPKALSVRTRPYHHGDLRRALVLAAVALLDREGLGALSLRATARQAGVSPAAPYHHFKDKDELLEAVAAEGFARLKRSLDRATAKAAGPEATQAASSLAYVEFSRRHPALYRVMWDTARNRGGIPGEGGEIGLMADAQFGAIAAWCAAHGLAELCACREFAPLVKAMGGEQAFVRAVLGQLGGG